MQDHAEDEAILAASRARPLPLDPLAFASMTDGPARCDSCGRDDDPVVAVHRVYVTPESWDTPGKVDVVDEVEQWCFVCRSHYPHQAVEPPE